MKNQIVRTGVLFLIFSFQLITSAATDYLCESSFQSNGATKLFKTSLDIQFDREKYFTKFEANTIDQRLQYKQGKWKFLSDEKLYSIDLLKLISKYKKNNISLWLKLSPYLNDEQISLSPYLIRNSKKSKSPPYMQVLFYEPTLPVYESIGLPFDAHYVKSGDSYIEYSYKKGMINRIVKSAKSSYQKKSHVCIKSKTPASYTQSFKNTLDITFQPNKWPKTLTPLKESIAYLAFDNYLRNLEELSQFEKQILAATSQVKLIQRSNIHFTQNKIDLAQNFLSQFNKLEQSDSKLKVYFSPKITREVLYTAKLDKTKKAQNRYAFIPNKTLNLNSLNRVVLSKNTKGYFFTFNDQTEEFNIEIGPIDLKKIMWKNLYENKSSCTQKMMKHFSEYERKSFIIKNASSDFKLSVKDIEKAIKYRAYPINKVILTNNCRGLGNFEYEIPGIIKGYFQIPPSILLNQVSKEMEWANIFTEVRPTDFYANEFKKFKTPNTGVKDYLVSKWSKYREKDYKWIKLSDFNKLASICSLDNILKDFFDRSKFKTTTIIENKDDFINYERFLHETRIKSGDLGEASPLSYVKTPCSKNNSKPPYAFRAPRFMMGVSGKDLWQQGSCEWIPYQFQKYSDIGKYKVGLSAFEVDGVYTGHNYDLGDKKHKDYKSLAKTDKKRVPYDFTNISKLKGLSYNISNGLLDILIESADKSINLYIGKIPLKALEKEESRKLNTSVSRPWYVDNFKGVYNLIGFSPYPLASHYNEADLLETVSFFFDQSKILNHHDPSIGVEQWYLTKKGKVLTLDLISHERIMPLMQFSFRLD